MTEKQKTKFRTKAQRSDSRRLYLRVGDRVRSPATVNEQEPWVVGEVVGIPENLVAVVKWDHAPEPVRVMGRDLMLCEKHHIPRTADSALAPAAGR